MSTSRFRHGFDLEYHRAVTDETSNMPCLTKIFFFFRKRKVFALRIYEYIDLCVSLRAVSVEQGKDHLLSWNIMKKFGN